MKTCVLPFRRRNGFEWTIRSRSRWNGVRTSALVLGLEAAARLVRAHRERRERVLLLLADASGEGVGDLSGELGHLRSLDAFLSARARLPLRARVQMMIGTVPPSALHAAPVT